jgi:hypothetical protein
LKQSFSVCQQRHLTILTSVYFSSQICHWNHSAVSLHSSCLYLHWTHLLRFAAHAMRRVYPHVLTLPSPRSCSLNSLNPHTFIRTTLFSNILAGSWPTSVSLAFRTIQKGTGGASFLKQRRTQSPPPAHSTKPNFCVLHAERIYVFHIVLTVNSDCLPVELCNGDVMCFLRGTNWNRVFS